MLKADAASYTPKLRLSREQQDDKQALEDEIKFAKKELDEAGDDAEKKKASAAQLAAKEAELKQLVEGFEARPGRARPAQVGRGSTRACAPARRRCGAAMPRRDGSQSVGSEP